MPERVIVFDVTQTLLDLAGLDQPFTDVFGTAQARSDWFEQLLNLATTTALVGTFDDCTTLGMLRSVWWRPNVASHCERNKSSISPDISVTCRPTRTHIPHWNACGTSPGRWRLDARRAFVAREGTLFNPLAPPPDVIEPTLEAVAEAIVRMDGQAFP